MHDPVGAPAADTFDLEAARRAFPCLGCVEMTFHGPASSGFSVYMHGQLENTYLVCPVCQPHANGHVGTLSAALSLVRPHTPQRYVACGAQVVDRAEQEPGDGGAAERAAVRAAERQADALSAAYARACGERGTQRAVAAVRRALQDAHTLQATFIDTPDGWRIARTVFAVDGRDVPFLSAQVEGWEATWELQQAAIGLEVAVAWMAGGHDRCTVAVDRAGVSVAGEAVAP